MHLDMGVSCSLIDLAKCRGAVFGLLLTLLCGLSVACSPTHTPDADLGETRVVLDLVGEFRFAELQREMDVIDIGSDGVRTPHGAVWGIGDSSSFEFFTSTLDERTLVASCKPFHFPDAPAQRISLAVNGKMVAEVKLDPGPNTVRWTIPSATMRIGSNRLTFHYAYSRPPMEVWPDSSDPRPLAVSWDWIRFQGAHSSPVPSLDSESQLILPFRSQANYFLSLPAGSTLELGAITLLSAPTTRAPTVEPNDATLIVEVESEASAEITEHQLTLSTESQRLPLGEFAGVVRLSLRGLPAGGKGSALRIAAARVVETVKDPPEVATARRAAPFNRPNILLFVVDTLRADALGAYGGRPEISPRIDEFAHEAILFSNARANASWTRPGVASLLTGLTPWQHGVQAPNDGLTTGVDTLAEILQRAGYATTGFITNGNINREFGFAQGFDRYIALPEDSETRSLHRDSADLRQAATSWLSKRPDESPFFLYMHASDPHAPYAPPSPQRERFVAAHEPTLETIDYVKEISRKAKPIDEDTRSKLEALYLAEVAFVDEQFGLLLDEFERLGLLDDTIVVFTSDHGEEFYDHGWWQHGKTLYGEQLRIPLIIKLNDERQGALSNRLVEQIDLLPTLLAQLGLPVPDGVTNRDALSDQWHERPALAVLNREGRHVESVIEGRFKLIDTHSYAHPLGLTPEVQLFDLRHDPGEQHNLAPERPIRVGYLRSVIRRERERGDVQPEVIEINAETRRTLRALGYIE
jgi:arylsulfatase A-like enzyme